REAGVDAGLDDAVDEVGLLLVLRVRVGLLRIAHLLPPPPQLPPPRAPPTPEDTSLSASTPSSRSSPALRVACAAPVTVTEDGASRAPAEASSSAEHDGHVDGLARDDREGNAQELGLTVRENEHVAA